MTKLIIKDYSEITQRELFNFSQHVTIENFGSLISLVRLPKQQEHLTKCQIHKKEQTCNHHFMHGYLILTTEMTEAIIGCDCGNQYFHLDKKFSIQRNTLENEIALEETISSLSLKLAALDGQKVSEVEEELKSIGKKIRSVRNVYSDITKRILDQKAKSKNSTVYVAVDQSETKQNGNKKHSWRQESIGNIKGLYIWNYQYNLGHAFTLMKELKQTLPTVILDKKQGIRKLKKWDRTLSTITEINDSIEKANNDYLQFIARNNILLTTRLIRNSEERVEIVSRLLTNKNKKTAQLVLKEFDRQTSSIFSNKNIRFSA